MAEETKTYKDVDGTIYTQEKSVFKTLKRAIGLLKLFDLDAITESGDYSLNDLAKLVMVLPEAAEKLCAIVLTQKDVDKRKQNVNEFAEQLSEKLYPETIKQVIVDFFEINKDFLAGLVPKGVTKEAIIGLLKNTTTKNLSTDTFADLPEGMS